MHKNSLKIMSRLLDKHAPKEGLCVDVGSQDINGTYRPLVEERGLRYLGVDIAPGKNVDYVAKTEGMVRFSYDYQTPSDQDWPDLVISGQCLEHTRNPWRWIEDVRDSLLTPGVPFIVIAPGAWPLHRYPVDCWRVLPDGMRALMEDAEFEVLEVGMDDPTGRKTHVDCWGVGRLK